MHITAHRARSLVALAAMLAAVAVALLTAAPRASADTPAGSGRDACNYDGGFFYACLHLEYKGFGWYNASAVLHTNLPEQYARTVLNCDPKFTAKMYGNDGVEEFDREDDYIRDLVPSPGFPTANWSGLEGRFYTVDIAGSQLDEDDGGDEVYVLLSYRDCITGLTRSFKTDDMVGNFG